ncbi:MAG: glycosyltransferase family 25 protein [Rhizobiaceae bacterium]|nr:glycosyltransferase family 25 protein [Rhizobiaceae bacterium]
MKCYLINLDRSGDRLARMRERFHAIGMDYFRVSAIDGCNLSERDVKIFLKDRRSRRWNYGEIGCFLSHLKTWQIFVESGEDFAAIFEDDAFMSAELTSLLAGSGWIPEDADIVRLETTFWKTEIGAERTKLSGKLGLHRLLSLHHGAGAYILSARAAKWLLDNNDLLRTTIDSAMFDFQEKSCRSLKIYQINPAPVLQETVYRLHFQPTYDAQSQIFKSDWVPTPEWPLKLRKLWREIKRPYRKFKDGFQQKARENKKLSVVGKIDFYGRVENNAEKIYRP